MRPTVHGARITSPDRFRRRLEATPFSETEWQMSADRMDDPDPVGRAIVIRCRQSLAGRMDAFAAITKRRTRRGMNEQASAWLSVIDRLPAVHARLARVVILNRPALDVIRQQDGEQTLFYLDPPYLHKTRVGKDVYACEMCEQEHCELLDLIVAVKGKAMLSGYRSSLYNQRLADWVRHEFRMPNHAAGGARKRRMVECVWCNFEPPEQGDD